MRTKNKTVNVILVFTNDEQKVLMCKRTKEPYLGLYNLVGGKVEAGEDGLTAAYRELLEETGIGSTKIRLVRLMDFVYPLDSCTVEVYAGILLGDVILQEEEHPLIWMPVQGTDFFDMTRFAGEGNIGHMMKIAKLFRDRLIGW